VGGVAHFWLYALNFRPIVVGGGLPSFIIQALSSLLLQRGPPLAKSISRTLSSRAPFACVVAPPSFTHSRPAKRRLVGCRRLCFASDPCLAAGAQLASVSSESSSSMLAYTHTDPPHTSMPRAAAAAAATTTSLFRRGLLRRPPRDPCCSCHHHRLASSSSSPGGRGGSDGPSSSSSKDLKWRSRMLTGASLDRFDRSNRYDRLLNQSINQSLNQPTNQSISPITHTSPPLPPPPTHNHHHHHHQQYHSGDRSKAPDQPGSYVKMSFARANLRATGECGREETRYRIFVGVLLCYCCNGMGVGGLGWD
jgi:hypothetical protein